MEHLVDVVRIAFTVLLMWTFVLSYAAGRFMMKIRKARGKVRGIDLVLTAVTVSFMVFSAVVLVFFPALLERLPSVFAALSVGATFAVTYFTEYLVRSIRAVRSK